MHLPPTYLQCCIFLTYASKLACLFLPTKLKDNFELRGSAWSEIETQCLLKFQTQEI